MQILPGTERIIEESLELISLANTFFVSSQGLGKIAPHPYIDEALSGRSERLIIEKLLAVAIKVRFLDEKTQILKSRDRAIPSAGKVESAGGEIGVGLREALNKIIHHEEIELSSVESNTTVVPSTHPASSDELLIIPGQYRLYQIQIVAKGKKGKEDWRFETDLFRLVNEVLRVFYLDSKEEQNGP